jgi:hypothetical protein
MMLPKYTEIFVTLMQTLFLEMEVIQSQMRGIGWVFHLSNRFLGQKLLDREHLVNWCIVVKENPIVGPKFRPISMHVTVPLSKCSCIAMALILEL